LLHPPLLDENGLSEAIPWYLQGLAERSGLSTKLNISENFGRLPAEMELAVFRIVQECLTNIHRHSGSKTATIRLWREDESVSLEIQDEGRGMPAEKLAEIQRQRSGVGASGSSTPGLLRPMSLPKLNRVEPPRYRTRMPGVGGVALRGVPLSRSRSVLRH